MKKQDSKSIILGGGLDTVTPPLLVAPGKLLQAKNFECDLSQGYKLMSGYELFDGRQSPTNADFYALALTSEDGAVVGNTVTGDSSGASGVIIAVFGSGSTGVYLVSLAGNPFTVGEGFTSGLTGDVVAVELLNVAATGDDFNTVRLVKEDYFSDLIDVVPGEGNVLGVFRHLSTTIAFRNKSGGATAGMYKASATGWTEVSLGHIVFFGTAANDNLVVVGATVSDGVSDTATIEAVGYDTVGKDNIGYFVLSGYTAGFAVSANMTISASAVGTVTTAAAAIELEPDGRYEFRSHNFTGTTDEYNVYGADGKNPAFEYWPTRNIYVPIYTDLANVALEFPTFVAVYQEKLFVGFERGIARNSGFGDPFDWDAAVGTLEFGIGAVITGFDETPESLLIGTRRTTYVITGQDIDTFILDVASSNTGAVKHTMQHIGTTYMFDDRGIIDISRVQAFGNFENATVSRQIQPKLIELRPNIVASTVSLSKNIYRLFANNGEGVSMTVEADHVSFALFNLGVNITCASNAEDETGVERILIGDDSGFVYEMDKGRSFAGSVRQSWVQFPYHFLGSTTVLKRFFRMFMAVLIDGEASITISAKFSQGSGDRKSTTTVTTELMAQADLESAFDVGLFDVMLFDGRIALSDVYADLVGSGESIGITISHTSATDDIFTLQDLTYYFKKRRALRSKR